MNDLLIAGCSFVAGGFTTAWALLVLSLAQGRQHNERRPQ